MLNYQRVLFHAKKWDDDPEMPSSTEGTGGTEQSGRDPIRSTMYINHTYIIIHIHIYIYMYIYI